VKNTIIIDSRAGLEESLRHYDPATRFWIGLFACAALAHLVPVLIMVVAGQWVNEVLSFVVLAGAIFILVLQNLMANKLKRIWLVNFIAAFLYSAHCFRLMAQQAHNLTQGLEAWWGTFMWVIVACLLNAALFVQYKKIADLD
jgi:hypothetical protein